MVFSRVDRIENAGVVVIASILAAEITFSWAGRATFLGAVGADAEDAGAVIVVMFAR